MKSSKSAKAAKAAKSTKSTKGYSSAITKKQIIAAQNAWGEGIVKIASAHTADENYVEVARDHIRTLYAYGITPVLFKPTLAAEQQFRSTFAGALSYFVASNNAATEDKGFAIKGWTAVRFENVDILTEGNIGMAMGNYFFHKS